MIVNCGFIIQNYNSVLKDEIVAEYRRGIVFIRKWQRLYLDIIQYA